MEILYSILLILAIALVFFLGIVWGVIAVVRAIFRGLHNLIFNTKL